MPQPKVLITGLGIAGPTLALLLKHKNYTPIILERNPPSHANNAGASLLLQPNGLKVLSLLNLSAEITDSSPELRFIKDIRFDGTEIGGTEFFAKAKTEFGEPVCGVKRSELLQRLKEACEEAGIPILEKFKLSHITETNECVTALSSDNREQKADFLIGCDGAHSFTRKHVLSTYGKEEGRVDFTGLVQIAGISEVAVGGDEMGMRNWYGDGKHVIAYPITSNTLSWAITTRSDVKEMETWTPLSSGPELSAFKDGLVKEFEAENWCEEVRNLIKGAEKIIRYGLYDRPHMEPEHWVSREGKSVLVGDAAHPTSPHLGQGANQALEDCWWLAELLPDLSRNGENAERLEDLREGLRDVFLRFAGKRQLRTKELVVGARRQGELRVVEGVEEGRERDEVLRRGWEDKEGVEVRFRGLWREPFDASQDGGSLR